MSDPRDEAQAARAMPSNSTSAPITTSKDEVEA